MTVWTAALVEERLVEAADVLKRLPEVKVRGYFNTWPQMVHEFADLVGQEPRRLRRPPPTSAAISRMEEALPWLQWLEPELAKLVWARAEGTPWKPICWTVGLQRSAAHEHWLYALCVIAFRLNGRRFKRDLSKREVIELAGSAHR